MANNIRKASKKRGTNNLGAAKKPGRVPIIDDPKLRQRALLIYSLVRFDGMSYTAAWKTAYPRTKAHNASSSVQGKKYYEWAEENLSKDVEAMLESQGVDPGKIARKIADLMEAQQFRTILEVQAGGKKKEKVVELPDPRIQLEATRTAADMLGIRGQKMRESGEKNQTMIVFNVGTNLEKPDGSGE